MRARVLAACLALGVARCATPAPPPAEPAPPSAPAPPPPASVPIADASIDDATVVEASIADVAAEEASAPPWKGPRHCRSEVWGGWQGTPECRAKAARVVPAKHKPCEVDADCVMVGTPCVPHAVSTQFQQKYDEVYACGNPAAGQCANRWHAACVRGCCDLVGNW